MTQFAGPPSIKRKRHSRADILSKARQAAADLAAGASIEQICVQYEVSAETLNRWLRKYETTNHEPVPRLRQLEQENRRLRKTVAQLEFDKQVLSTALQGNF